MPLIITCQLLNQNLGPKKDQKLLKVSQTGNHGMMFQLARPLQPLQEDGRENSG